MAGLAMAAKAADRKAEKRVRQDLADACRAINASGVNQGASGNISLRFGEAMLITPSGVDYDRLAPGMIVAMALSAEDAAQDEKTGMRASSEWRFHRDIFRARPDVHAVVHAHAPYATVLSMLRRPIPASHYMIAAFGGARIECTDYAPFGTQALSDLALAGLGQRHGVLLGSHGMIAVGHDLERALWLAGELETIAKLHYLACLLGDPVILPEAETLALCGKFDAYGPGSKTGSEKG
jgi:L-fuculose-phosphate aldolase